MRNQGGRFLAPGLATLVLALGLLSVTPRTASSQSNAPIPNISSWGKNDGGQTGAGEPQGGRTSPGPVFQGGGLTNVKAIAAGFNHSLALDDQGHVWSWGNGAVGQLGEEDLTCTPSRPTPQRVAGLDGEFIQIAAGWYWSMALKSDGTVWTWGWNSAFVGSLGRTSVLAKSTCTPRGGTVIAEVPTPAPVIFHEHPVPERVEGPAGENVKAIATSAGSAGGVVIRNDGTVWGWGTTGPGNSEGGVNQPTGSTDHPYNQSKDLGRPVAGLPNDVVSIATGAANGFAVSADGTVRGWGATASGQLGPAMPSATPAAIPIVGLDGVLQVSAGGSIITGALSNQNRGGTHVVALRNDGTVWTWGSNSKGQLGYDSGDQRCRVPGVPEERCSTTPRMVPQFTAATLSAFVADNSVLEGNEGTKPASFEVSLNRDMGKGARLVTAGPQTTYAVKYDGAAMGWGDNEHGQVGNGTKGSDFPTPEPVKSLNSVAAISASNHVLTLESSSLPQIKAPPVAIDYRSKDLTANGEDYEPAAGRIDFPSSERAQTMSFPMQVKGDTTVEPDETFGVDLSDPGLTLPTLEFNRPALPPVPGSPAAPSVPGRITSGPAPVGILRQAVATIINDDGAAGQTFTRGPDEFNQGGPQTKKSDDIPSSAALDPSRSASLQAGSGGASGPPPAPAAPAQVNSAQATHAQFQSNQAFESVAQAQQQAQLQLQSQVQAGLMLHRQRQIELEVERHDGGRFDSSSFLASAGGNGNATLAPLAALLGALTLGSSLRTRRQRSPALLASFEAPRTTSGDLRGKRKAQRRRAAA